MFSDATEPEGTPPVEYDPNARRHFPGLDHPAVLGLRAQPAPVDWLGSSPPQPNLGRALIYLGSGGGTAILFDSEARRTERLPESDLAIRVRAGATLCSEFD